MPHIHEKIDVTATVYVLYEKKVLLRQHDKYDLWLGVGGHVELDEDPNQAAKREVKEEVGLDIELVSTKEPIKTEKVRYLVAPEFMNMHPITDTHDHMDMIFYGRANTDNVVPEEEGDVWKWVTREELEEMKDELYAEVYEYARFGLENFTYA